ncbi:MAG: TylF/MycF/NovP-related O-methyltransferase [Lachnospiraceae bacterium]|nr:TylF/MycF/NovP-related O-methyltransferase [Lachnospiraceae bacterium]
MNTIVILGAGQFGRTAASLLNTNHLKLLAFGDNNPKLQGTSIQQVPVLSVEQAVQLKPDYLLTGVIDEVRSGQLRSQAVAAGFQGTWILLGDLYRQLDVRSATLFRLASRILQGNVPGDIAELGVYQGDLAWKLNAWFPGRRLYLFDTFEGFDVRDISIEQDLSCSKAQEGDFSDTSEAFVLKRLPHPETAVIRKGYFPDTAKGLEENRYAFVSLDADLYAPILAGLTYFYPRLSPGGMILLHDYNNERFRGARQAVEDFESKSGSLSLVPLCDLHGSAVIVHP